MAFEDIIQAILRMEGRPAPYPGTSLYNAGNLTWYNQAGATPVTWNGIKWAGWPTYSASVDGVRRDITAKARAGMTIQSAIEMYAPAKSGNNTPAYIAYVSGQTGYDPTVRLSDVIAGSVPVYSVPPVTYPVTDTPAPPISADPSQTAGQTADAIFAGAGDTWSTILAALDPSASDGTIPLGLVAVGVGAAALLLFFASRR